MNMSCADKCFQSETLLEPTPTKVTDACINDIIITEEEIMNKIKQEEGINNLLELKPRIATAEATGVSEEAFRQSAKVGLNIIAIKASNSVVTQRGATRSSATWREIERR